MKEEEEEEQRVRVAFITDMGRKEEEARMDHWLLQTLLSMLKGSLIHIWKGVCKRKLMFAVFFS